MKYRKALKDMIDYVADVLLAEKYKYICMYGETDD
jgi:hypothetical protein